MASTPTSNRAAYYVYRIRTAFHGSDRCASELMTWNLPGPHQQADAPLAERNLGNARPASNAGEVTRHLWVSGRFESTDQVRAYLSCTAGRDLPEL